MFEFLNLSRDQLLEECTVRTDRGSGPGGSKADTTESTVRITHEPTGVTAAASEHRSQHENRRRALRRLRREYALQVRHGVNPERIQVSEALRPYLERGLRINPSNPHYPFMVKLVLDLLEAHRGRLSEAADTLGVSTNRLSQFLTNHDALHERANALREAHGHGSVH